MRKNQVFTFTFLLIFSLMFPTIPTHGVDVGSVIINKNVSTTNSRKVTLYLFGAPDTVSMRVSNDTTLVDAGWEPFTGEKEWFLSYGGGTKVVYVQYKNKNGDTSQIYTGKIQLNLPQSMSATIHINKGETQTNSRYVQITVTSTPGVEEIALSNDKSGQTATFQPIQPQIPWILPDGKGKKIVYAFIKDGNGKQTLIQDDIFFEPAGPDLGVGTLLKGQTDTLYYYGFDGKLHPFLNKQTYHSWHGNFSKIAYVSNVKLAQYQIGHPVCVRPGTWLVRFSSSNKIFAVEPGCRIKPIRSEAEAFILYGPNWASRIVNLSDTDSNYYTIHSLGIVSTSTSTKDIDKDGVDSVIEDQYATSDGDMDSDDDGLSDYEEIYYWFSNPMKKDTDEDGYTDGKEILLGFSPGGTYQISYLDSPSYVYPAGSVFYNSADGKFLYQHSNGVAYSLGKKLGTSPFVNNNVDTLFLSNPPYGFTGLGKATLPKSVPEMMYPTMMVNNTVVTM